VFYKLLGLLTWKAIKFYLDQKVPTRKLAAGAIVGTVGVVAIAAALKGRETED
jgi:ammonia channel protein AmtB